MGKELFKYSRTYKQTLNLQQQEHFFQAMSRQRSRAASVPKEDAIVTEIVNGLIVSKPAKKIEYLSTTEKKNESEPIVIDLQQHAKSKAGSVPGINKLKVIHEFYNRGY